MKNDINVWLDHLQILLAPTGVVLVGAGTGTGDWVRRLLQWNATNVTLVEADETQFERLEHSLGHCGGWHICSEVIARETGTVTYHQASNIAESGLIEPTSLLGLWPNIKTAAKQSRQAISLADLLNEALTNWLLVDCLPALPIILGAGSLNNIDVIAARVVLDETHLPDMDTELSALQAYLIPLQYRLLAIEPGRHPAIGRALFVRDLQTEMRELRQQYARLKEAHIHDTEFHASLLRSQEAMSTRAEEFSVQVKKLTEEKDIAEKLATTLHQQIESSNRANADHIQQLEQNKKELTRLTGEKDALINQLSQVKVQLDVARTKVDANGEQLGTAVTEISIKLSDLSQQVQTVALESEKFQVLSGRLDAVLTEQKNQTEQTRQKYSSELKSGLDNVVRQVESYIAMNAYLERRQIPLNVHGWPISPDIAVFLLNKIENENYDLIIEFGSGTSTVLFAMALRNKANGLPSMKKNCEGSDVDSSAEVPHSPPQIISFEHDKLYHGRTCSRLAKEGLEKLVDLVHAPLVEYQYKGEAQLYYSCSQALEQVANALGNSFAKILVLVDGPPGALGPRSRFPALPHLLSKLAKHRIDIALDDYNRKEEKAIVEEWKSMLRDRSIPYSEESVVCEKGTFFCRLN